MTPPSVQTANLGKEYRVGEQESYRALRDVIAAGLRSPRSRRSRETQDPRMWALRNVDLELHGGEALGLVGANGAGKSTLLKILSRITAPTEGHATLYGRLGSLLEVGTGFHSELTGRENVFLNGSILGMKRAEIRRRFDEIVEFSGISRYLDTPVKRYSSGMRVRLGFAVAAHLDLDILLVDEVLAVGDVAFQQKCLGKMNEVASRGRTVVFVSHNTSAVNRLCTRAVYLRGGRLVDDGSPVDVTAKYLNENSAGQGERTWPDADTAPGSDTARVRAVRLISEDCVVAAVHIDKAASIEVDFQIRRRGNRTLMVAIYVTDAAGAVAFSTANVPGANLLPDDWFDHEHDPGTYRATCTIPPQFLNDVRYYVGVHLVSHDAGTIEANAERAIAFDVVDTGVMRDNDREWHGAVRPRFLWTTRALGSLDMDVSSINSEPARFNPAAQ